MCKRKIRTRGIPTRKQSKWNPKEVRDQRNCNSIAQVGFLSYDHCCAYRIHNILPFFSNQSEILQGSDRQLAYPEWVSLQRRLQPSIMGRSPHITVTAKRSRRNPGRKCPCGIRREEGCSPRPPSSPSRRLPGARALYFAGSGSLTCC